MHDTHVQDKKRIAGFKYEEIHGKNFFFFLYNEFYEKNKKTETRTF